MVVHIYNPSTSYNPEAAGSPVWSHSGLQSEILSQVNKEYNEKISLYISVTFSSSISASK
jgi:hypothetical protein